MFLGGVDNSAIARPFGSAILDGVDLDIENNQPEYIADFITELRRLWSADVSRQYYVSSAPQCPYPDRSLGPDKKHGHVQPTAISHAWFDWLNLQYYNNDCGVAFFGTKAFNFDNWAKHIPVINVNKNVKLMLGIPAGPKAGDGYVNASRMAEIISVVRVLPAFAGVMMWDDDYAEANAHYQRQIKSILVNGTSTSRSSFLMNSTVDSNDLTVDIAILS